NRTGPTHCIPPRNSSRSHHTIPALAAYLPVQHRPDTTRARFPPADLPASPVLHISRLHRTCLNLIHHLRRAGPPNAPLTSAIRRRLCVPRSETVPIDFPVRYPPPV